MIISNETLNDVHRVVWNTHGNCSQFMSKFLSF